VIPFSVGEIGTAELGDDDVVVMVVVVGDGAWLLLLAHAALIAPDTMTAAQPATAIALRLFRFEFIVSVRFCKFFIADLPLASGFSHVAVRF
jgi:hypothetical protein